MNTDSINRGGWVGGEGVVAPWCCSLRRRFRRGGMEPRSCAAACVLLDLHVGVGLGTPLIEEQLVGVEFDASHLVDRGAPRAPDHVADRGQS